MPFRVPTVQEVIKAFKESERLRKEAIISRRHWREMASKRVLLPIKDQDKPTDRYRT